MWEKLESIEKVAELTAAIATLVRFLVWIYEKVKKTFRGQQFQEKIGEGWCEIKYGEILYPSG
jgi:hypothetical protein